MGLRHVQSLSGAPRCSILPKTTGAEFRVRSVGKPQLSKHKENSQMATKKKAAKKRGGAKLDIGSDPPIIVGGGGSTWIWIKRDTNLQLFDPNNLPNTVTPP